MHRLTTDLLKCCAIFRAAVWGGVTPRRVQNAVRRVKTNQTSSPLSSQKLDERVQNAVALQRAPLLATLQAWPLSSYPPRKMPRGGGGAGSQAQRMQRIIDAFQRFDTDGSGKLEAEEVVNILTRSSKRAMTKAEANKFIKQFDRNGDGQMDIKEFSRAWDMLEEQYGGIDVTRMKQEDWVALKHFDDDGSGVLEMDELLAILMHSNGRAKGMSEKDARAFIALFDKDGDGNIDAKEFAAFHRNLRQGKGGDAAQKTAQEIQEARSKELGAR